MAMIPERFVNYLVILTWGSIPWVYFPVVCSKVHSTRDAAVAILDVAVASTLPRGLVEPREQPNAPAGSAFPVLQVPLSSMPRDAHRVADGARLSDDANRQQFHVALLENCSFFAHLVLRHVRAGGDPSSCSLDRDSPRKKLNLAKASKTPPQSSSNILARHKPAEERILQPEVSTSFLQTLWVEVGCRSAQTLVSEKERHEYREDSKPAL